MRAVVTRSTGIKTFVLSQVDGPSPDPSEALVRVEAFSLNLGEVRRAITQPADGWRPGWDFAGVVERSAADGSGPAVGARVVGFAEEGAWAEAIAIGTRSIAEIPASVSIQQASTLPVAGLTALKALEKGGLLVGKKVLINGASGGVGHFACQLARASGAYVIGAVRRDELREQVLDDGAHEVIVDADLSSAASAGPFDLILESVGGVALATALTMLERDGVCVTYGNSAQQAAPIDVSKFYLTGRPRLEGLFLVSELRYEPPALGLSRLLRSIEAGHVVPRIEIQAPWDEVDKIAKSLFGRRVSGKAVLNIG